MIENEEDPSRYIVIYAIAQLVLCVVVGTVIAMLLLSTSAKPLATSRVEAELRLEDEVNRKLGTEKIKYELHRVVGVSPGGESYQTFRGKTGSEYLIVPMPQMPEAPTLPPPGSFDDPNFQGGVIERDGKIYLLPAPAYGGPDKGGLEKMQDEINKELAERKKKDAEGTKGKGKDAKD